MTDKKEPVVLTDIEDGEYGLDYSEIMRLENQIIEYFAKHGLLVNIYLQFKEINDRIPFA